MKFPWKNKQKLIDDGLISFRKHPTHDLWIYNYTAKAQYEYKWTDELRAVRGLILDAQDNIICRPIPKFFNLDEYEQNGWELKPVGCRYFEKMDGCFRYDTPIQCWDGSTIRIGEIVRKKLTPILIGMDENGNLVPSKVLDHFDNGTKDNWLAITVDTPVSKKSGAGSHKNIIRITDNHEIFLNNNFIQANMAKIGDEITTFDYDLLPPAIHVIRSGLLGDGCITGSRYVEGHKIEHAEYIAHIKSLLGDSVVVAKNSISGFGTEIGWIKTKEFKILQSLRNEWYPNNKKTIPDDISWIDDFSVAKWYMDDGSLLHNNKQKDRALFATNSFSEQDCIRLSEKINELYGVECVVYYSKGWCIRINSGEKNNIDSFWERISPYIVPCMRYKLPEKYRQDKFIDKYPKSNYSFKKSIGKIINIEKIEVNKKNFPSGRVGFDIKTETSNYFAKGILVHNCLGILYWVGEEPFIASRGSFEGFAADAGNELVKKLNLKKSDFPPNTTQIFEIIHPDTRIIVDYAGKKSLVYLATIDNETGKDLFIDTPNQIERVVEYSSLMDWINLDTTNREGVIMLCRDGTRAKIKFSKYLELHKVLTGLTPRMIWEVLSKAKNSEMEYLQFLEAVPDEFYDWVCQTKDQIIDAYQEIYNKVKKIVDKYNYMRYIHNKSEVAQEIIKNHPEESGLIFAFIKDDAEGLSNGIWKKIYPEPAKPMITSGFSSDPLKKQ